MRKWIINVILCTVVVSPFLTHYEQQLENKGVRKNIYNLTVREKEWDYVIDKDSLKNEQERLRVELI